jgi:hypothetical protein
MILPSYDRMIHQVDVLLLDTEATSSVGSLNGGTSVIHSGFNCLILDEGGGRVNAYGRDVERKAVTVLFLDPIDLKLGNQLRYLTPAGKTRIFVVNSFRDDQDQGRLWVTTCEEQPDAATD